MEELIENASDYGIYIVDRRAKGVDDSVNQLTNYMEAFCEKSRRQRINQRNRTERLSDLLDWKRMGMEYVKARQLALRRGKPQILILLTTRHANDFQPIQTPSPMMRTSRASLTMPSQSSRAHCLCQGLREIVQE